MNIWLAAAIAVIPAFLLAVIAAGRLAIHWRLVAVELASSLAVVLLLVLSFAFDQASSIDLALAVAVLTLPGAMLLIVFQERWL